MPQGDPDDPGDAGLDRLRPLYEQVKERLRAAIEGGVLAEGAFLPSEAELCAQFGVSRITLRRAVSDLCAAGLLLRQQGRGTVVTRAKRRQELVSLSGFSDTLEGDGEAVEHRVLEREDEAVAPEAARALGRAPRAPLVRFTRLILVGGRPFTLEALVLAPDRVPRVLDAVAAGASLFHSLRDAYGIEVTAADRLIDAGFPTPEERRHLALGSSRPVFRITKTTYGPDGALAWSRLVTPTDLVTLSIRTAP